MEPTYYDFLLRLRPYIVELAEKDARMLLEREDPPTCIASADEFKSSLPEVFDRTGDDIALMLSKQTRIEPAIIKAQLQSGIPELKSHIASFYMTANLEYHTLLNFALNGKRTFTFSDNLSEHLANTSLTVKAEMIKLPFTSCMFHFTSNAFVNNLYSLNGEVGRRMINAKEVDYSAGISVFLTTLPASPLPGEKLLMTVFHAKQPDKAYMATKREIYLGPDWSLEQSLRTNWEELTPDNLGIGMAVSTDEDAVTAIGDEAFYTDGFVFYRSILNAILYIGSEHAQLTPERSRKEQIIDESRSMLSNPRRKKKLQEANRFSALDNILAGKDVQPITIKRGVGESSEAKRFGGKNKPSIQILVRGHWRTQGYGEGAKEKKLIRIEPYYRGPDMADLVSKPYLVK